MAKLPKNQSDVGKRASRVSSNDPKSYKQKTKLEYKTEYFELYQKELKTDLCWAIDTNDLALLEDAYKEARKLLGVSKGRPKTISNHIKVIREEVKANFCLYLAELLDQSYSSVWAEFFLNKHQPKKPDSDAPHLKVRFWCEHYPKDVRDHLFNVLDPDTTGRKLLTKLLDSADNK